MTPTKRLTFAIVTLFLLTGLGTLGYVAIAGMSFLDALYMTVITLSTVGYMEVQPLGTSGRIYTMILILAGVGTMFYAITAPALAGQPG